MKKVLTVIFLVFLSGCSLSEGMEDAKNAVAKFHDQFSAEDYEGIYQDSTTQLKDATSREEFFPLIKSFRDVLGKPLSSKMQNFNMSTSITDGTVFTGVYVTEFENGTGTETFVFKKENDTYKLQKYNLNSNDYIRILREMAEAKPSV